VGLRLDLGGEEVETVGGWCLLGSEWVLWALWEGHYVSEATGADISTDIMRADSGKVKHGKG